MPLSCGVPRRLRNWLQGFSWRRQTLRTYTVAFLFVLAIISSFRLLRPPDPFRPKLPAWKAGHTIAHEFHPVDRLHAAAASEHASRLAQRSASVAEAAARYRERRGRHPPPGFGAWFAYAQRHDAIVVESFFDRVYKDLGPLWALAPSAVAERAATLEPAIRVRDGHATTRGDSDGRIGWLTMWTELLSEVADQLPDVDMPINPLDESRLFVPWETIEKMAAAERDGRVRVAKTEVVKSYSGLGAMDARKLQMGEPNWITHGSMWDIARAACSPDSPSRSVQPATEFSSPPSVPDHWNDAYSYRGFVSNFTTSSDVCRQPHLREMHGSFIKPATVKCTTDLIPIFGGSKLPMANEILIPGGAYLTKDPNYTGGNGHGPRWTAKLDGVIWRGMPTGGDHDESNWVRWQRSRLVEMLNGTVVAAMEDSGAPARTFEMPSASAYDSPRRRDGSIGRWLQQFANAGFLAAGWGKHLLPYMSVAQAVPMAVQYRYKFIPDVDGNSYSARFRALLMSTSLPIKATIYAEWLDDRLVPWLHFAPMDNTFQDIYSILDYFTRDKEGDDAARVMAEEGQQWANKVLRREDMLLWMWRVLLEFARICDPNRERLGFVDDL